jgi:ABC-type multidrug transport system ATPase subunit
MSIDVQGLTKKFGDFRAVDDVSFRLEAGSLSALLGPSGSGKSTLLQAISGSLLLNEGKCEWSLPQQSLTPENVYRHVSICAPYLELIEEMTAKEFLDFHQGFKPFLPGLTTQNIIEILGLEKATHKQIRFYSSGMKQRVKLAQCIFSDTALVLLDEPCTNLDSTGINLYHSLIQKYCSKRLVVVSSNDEVEYGFCKEKINISDYK